MMANFDTTLSMSRKPVRPTGIGMVTALMVFMLVAPPLTAAQPRPAWKTSRIQGTPEPPPPYMIEEAFGGLWFNSPVAISQIPGTQRFVVGELCGRIYSFEKNAAAGRVDLVIDLWAHLPNRPPPPGAGDRIDLSENKLPPENLLDFVFHPDFRRNRQFFVSYIRSGPVPQVTVSRFRMSTDDPPVILRESEQVVINWPAEGHNGGCVRFGPDGYMYISTGDSAMPIPPDSKNVGQDISNLHSSVLRIDVDRTEGDKPYAIPKDNPFRKMAAARPEVWAYGLRNPWKMDFDQETGDLWLGDVGWETWEMVHRVVAGGNYGWPIMEGRQSLRPEVARGPTAIIPPVKDYPRTEANSITGGVVYRGGIHEDLVGRFVYGDYRTGTIWSLADDGAGEYEHRELARTPARIVAFTQDSDGEIYVLDHDFTGKIYKLVPTPVLKQVHPFPTRLSDTGLFASVKSLEPAPGVVPYEINAEPWLDGAVAQRLVALPRDSRIQVADSGGWIFPEGAVLVRTLFVSAEDAHKPYRLETQLLHLENNTWRPYSYQWNEAQDDAELIGPAGSHQPVTIGHGDLPSGQRSWLVSGRSQCIMCHRVEAGSVLGFVPSQLNRQVKTTGSETNQMALFRELGVFDGDPMASVKGVIALTDPLDSRQGLDDRARSYLDVNCGICHNPGGEAITFFYLQRHLSLENSKALNDPAVTAFDIRDSKVVSPGDPHGSVLIYRMATLAYGRMPYVGSRVVDAKGLQLLRDWITFLDPGRPGLGADTTRAMKTLTDDNVSADLRQQAARQLLVTTRGGLALSDLMHRGSLPPSLHGQIVQLSQQSSNAHVRGLFEPFIPESRRRKRLGPNPDSQQILSLKGDVGRGRLIYTSDSSRCRACHIPDQRGQMLGPDLKQIGKKYVKADLLGQILDPSAKIEPEYQPYLLATRSGDLYSGLIVEKTAAEVTLRNASNELIRVEADEIELLQKQQKSTMPDQLFSDMTAQEAADLLAYLSSLK